MDSTSQKIMDIRSAAGNPCATCPTCTRPASVPFRRIVDGRYEAGCVDACHTEHLTGTISESARWHFRKEAEQIRRDELSMLRRLGGASW